MITKTNLKKEEDEKCSLSKNDVVGANFWKGVDHYFLKLSQALFLQNRRVMGVGGGGGGGSGG